MRNNFDIIGHLGKVHSINEKTVKADIAVNHPFKNKETGVWEKTTDWVSITFFDQLATRIQSYAIGSLISAEGRLKNTKFQKNNEMVYSISVIAYKLSMLHKKEIDNNGTANVLDTQKEIPETHETPSAS